MDLTSNGQEIILASIALACVRWNKQIENFPIEQFYKDLKSTFPTMSLDFVVRGIKEGSLGKYGNVYDLSIGQVFIWIRKYKEENTLQMPTL